MAENLEDQPITKERRRSVPVKVSFNNVPSIRPNGETISLYGRLIKYKKFKGISEQDVIRYAVSMLLDKVGY